MRDFILAIGIIYAKYILSFMIIIMLFMSATGIDYNEKYLIFFVICLAISFLRDYVDKRIGGK